MFSFTREKKAWASRIFTESLLILYGLIGLALIVAFSLDYVYMQAISLPPGLVLGSVFLTSIALIFSAYGIHHERSWGYYLGILGLGWDLLGTLVLIVSFQLLAVLYIELLFDWFLLVVLFYSMQMNQR